MEEEKSVEEPSMETGTIVGQEPQQLWWLASVDIVYRTGGLEKVRPVNVIFTTVTDYIAETIIGNINVAAQKQAMELKKIPEKAVIVDAVIRGFSMLGVMSASQFHNRKTKENEG
jgi:hypothetical protein